MNHFKLLYSFFFYISFQYILNWFYYTNATVKTYIQWAIYYNACLFFLKVIYVRLHQHIKSNNILVNEKYGFRSNSSTKKASYKLIDEILNALNNKILVGGIFYCLNWNFME
jgi:hypothetical protein